MYVFISRRTKWLGVTLVKDARNENDRNYNPFTYDVSSIVIYYILFPRARVFYSGAVYISKKVLIMRRRNIY